ncbi:hypothetical protein [Nostoc sp. FACHB-133]|nr:hypothetical protein [Nostoc sp. FACHB-133]MBD2527081.1 hypothetical protein [Nostoc sp. FACHB-133]
MTEAVHERLPTMDERNHSVFLGATAQAELPPAMNERNYFEATNERVY